MNDTAAPPRRRRRLAIVLIVGGAVIVAAIVAGAGFMQVTASPRFCASCHIMLPYVDAWKQSRHAHVECVQCHYPPDFKDAMWVKFQAVTQLAKWATDTYSSKPFADVRDASCLRSGCHTKAEVTERLVTRTFGRQVRFDHGRHLDPARVGFELRCTTCHAQVVVDKHFEASESVCFACHFKGAKGRRELQPLGGCTACHQAPSGEIVAKRFDHAEMVARKVPCQSCHADVITGRGEAPRERCIGCHNEQDKLGRYADVRLMHEGHVTKTSIECTRCHTEIVHRLPRTTAEAAPQGATGERR